MTSRFSGGMEENREKREESKLPQARFTAFLHGPTRAGWCRKGSGPRRETEERKETREEIDNHNQDERAAEGNSSVQEWCRKGSRLLGAESMA